MSQSLISNALDTLSSPAHLQMLYDEDSASRHMDDTNSQHAPLAMSTTAIPHARFGEIGSAVIQLRAYNPALADTYRRMMLQMADIHISSRAQSRTAFSTCVSHIAPIPPRVFTFYGFVSICYVCNNHIEDVDIARPNRVMNPGDAFGFGARCGIYLMCHTACTHTDNRHTERGNCACGQNDGLMRIRRSYPRVSDILALITDFAVSSLERRIGDMFLRIILEYDLQYRPPVVFCAPCWSKCKTLHFLFCHDDTGDAPNLLDYVDITGR
jgi:hypothetical protein